MFLAAAAIRIILIVIPLFQCCQFKPQLRESWLTANDQQQYAGRDDLA
jgi:hypothetical protein